MPVVNMVSCTPKFDTRIYIYHVKCSYHTHTHAKPETKERHKGTLGGVGYVFYLGSGHGFPGVFLCPNYSTCTHEICAILCISSTPEQHCWEKTNKQKQELKN